MVYPLYLHIPDLLTFNIYLQIQISGFKVGQETLSYNFSFIVLSFDDTVEVTEYRYAGLNFPKLCAEIGGALGLWLGLGIIQLFHEAFGMVRRLQQKFNETK